MAAPIISGLIQILKSYLLREVKGILKISYLLKASHVTLLKELFKNPSAFAKRLGTLSPAGRLAFSKDIERALKTTNAPFKGKTFDDSDIFKDFKQYVDDVTQQNDNSMGKAIKGAAAKAFKGKSGSSSSIPISTTKSASSKTLPQKPSKGTATSNKDLEYATYTRKDGKTKYTSEQQINQRVLELMQKLGLTEEEARAILQHQIDEGSEFRLLSSSWIQSGEYKPVALGIGELTISVIKTGKAYTYFGVVPQVWQAMKAAKGKNGSGAGSIFWALYLRGYKKSFYGRMQETMREMMGDKMNDILSKKAKKVVNMFPQITTATSKTKKVKKVVKKGKK